MGFSSPRPAIPHPQFPSFYLAAFLLLSAPSCEFSVPNPDDPIEKAKTIRELRERAQDAYATYVASDGNDTAALEEMVEYERITTEIAPYTCPRCFREYGYALSILGHHYRVLAVEDMEEAESAATPEEAEELRKEAEESRRLMREYFKESNQAYRAYFLRPDSPVIHPYHFERVMRHYELLEDYQNALNYLTRFVEAYPALGRMDEVTKQKVERLRRYYKRKLLLQRERGYRESLENRRDQGSRSLLRSRSNLLREER